MGENAKQQNKSSALVRNAEDMIEACRCGRVRFQGPAIQGDIFDLFAQNNDTWRPGQRFGDDIPTDL